jgi:hypothetical protein
MGRKWGGNGEVSLRATWDQGGRDRTTQEEGFQVSKRDSGERGISKGNWQRGIAKGITRDCAMCLVSLACICVTCCCMNVANKRMCLGYK